MKLPVSFPIKRSEIAKFLLTSLIMILTLYIYSILRGTKDTLIQSQIGTELISAIKLYGVLPSAVLMFMAYAKLADYLTRTTAYHVLNFFFLSFFFLFNFVLYPNAEALHLDLSYISEKAPALKYIVLMFNNWTFSMFYIMSELWGSMMLALMFWQLANQICSVEEAKRFYPLFGFLGQVGLASSGALLLLFSHPTFVSHPNETMNYITISVLAAGCLVSFTLHALGKVVGVQKINDGLVAKKKHKPSFFKSLQHIYHSKHIRCIALLIICYGVSINLVEGVWKKQVEIMYSNNTTNMNGFYGKVQLGTAIATFIAMLCGSYALRIFKWRTVALVSPAIILITGAVFFVFVIFSQIYNSHHIGMDTSKLILMAVVVGALQNVLSKAIKYSFFDPTKEIAYIPLEEEFKVKGKAAADVIGGRLGKSGGAVVQWLMLSFVTGSTLVSLSPSIFIVFVFILVVWFYAVFSLNRLLRKKV